MKKTIGILGGMGPLATADLFRKIVLMTKAGSDNEHIRIYIDNNSQIPDRTAGILGGREEEVFQHLLADAKLLERAGCTHLAIPCNTSHFFADRIQAELSIPLIHMPRETVKTIQASGKKTVGILATDGTIRTGIYQKELEKAGLTAVTPPEDIQKTVMSIIYDEIKRGETGSREKFAEIDAFLREAGCDLAAPSCRSTGFFTVCPLTISTPWRSWPRRPSSAAANSCGIFDRNPYDRKDYDP